MFSFRMAGPDWVNIQTLGKETPDEISSVFSSFTTEFLNNPPRRAQSLSSNDETSLNFRIKCQMSSIFELFSCIMFTNLRKNSSNLIF